MAAHTIDERCAYLDYVFGYDDTERIVVSFELVPGSDRFTVWIQEGGEKKLAKHTVEKPPEWEPNISYAEEVLLSYWNGDFKK